MIIVMLADGFEEIEALTPVDMLRRAGREVKTVSCVSGTRTATGSHGIPVICDLTPDEVDTTTLDAVIFPGGMPGSLNLDKHPFTDVVISAVQKNGGRLAAICAAPLVLGRRGLLAGKRATCYPGFENELKGAEAVMECVVTDGNVTTSRGMGTALMFAEELVRLTAGEEKAEEISLAIQKPTFTEYLMLDEDCRHESEEEEISLESLGLGADFFGALDGELEDEEEDEKAIAEDSLPDEFADPTDGNLTKIKELYESFDVKLRIIGKEEGAQVVRYLAVPLDASRKGKLTSLCSDLELALGVSGIRMTAPSFGQYAVGIEVPKKKRRPSYLKDMLDSEELKGASATTFPVGEGFNGKTVTADITKLPHLIAGGSAGSGVTSFIHSLITTLILRSRPEELKLLLIDPSTVQFCEYNGLENLLCPPVTDLKEAIGALRYATEEMERRYNLFEAASARNIDSYNENAAEKLPRIIICIDKYEELAFFANDRANAYAMFLAQKSRAAGIHLIICTEKPDYSSIPGVVKANIPSRICFRVASSVDSRLVLDYTGGEKLLGFGDMLYNPLGSDCPERLQLAFVSDGERQAYLDGFSKNAVYDEKTTTLIKQFAKANTEDGCSEEEDEEDGGIDEFFSDEAFLRAVDTVFENGNASTSLLQRKLSIGYGKAAIYIEVMEELGIISAPEGLKPRRLTMSRTDWLKLLENHE